MNKSALAWQVGETCMIPVKNKKYHGTILKTNFSAEGDYLLAYVEYVVNWKDLGDIEHTNTYKKWIQSYHLSTTPETRKARAEAFRQHKGRDAKVCHVCYKATSLYCEECKAFTCAKCAIDTWNAYRCNTCKGELLPEPNHEKFEQVVKLLEAK